MAFAVDSVSLQPTPYHSISGCPFSHSFYFPNTFDSSSLDFSLTFGISPCLTSCSLVFDIQNKYVGGSNSDSNSDERGAMGIVAGSTVDYEITEESRLVRERQEKAIQDLVMKRHDATLAVPTNDKAVRARLRRLAEPMTLSGKERWKDEICCK